MKKLNIFCFILFSTTIVTGQILTKGKYIGYEQNPFCYRSTCMVQYDTLATELEKGKWYYEIIIQVSDSKMTIEKIPIYFPLSKDSSIKIDSTFGGYYLYRVDQKPSEISTPILGFLDSCKFCPEKYGGNYKYKLTVYGFYKRNKKIYLNGVSDKSILLTKLE